MAKDKGSSKRNGSESPTDNSRRQFLKTGALTGVGGAAAVAGLGATPSSANAHDGIHWDRTVDVIVIGAGCSGLCAANAARDEGVEVMLVEHHFDIGGIAIMSGGDIRIAGGNRLQQAEGIEDSADAVFERWTDPVDDRFNDRELVRRFADENVATFDFLESHGVNFGRHGTTVSEGGRPGGLSGGGFRVRSYEWPIPTDILTPNQGRNGSGIVRGLERAARENGVEILLSHTLRDVFRQEQFSGRVLGVSVEQVDRWFQPMSRFLNIRARKGVVLCNGGHGNNVEFRRMFDPRLTEEYQWHGQDTAPANAAGEIAAMSIGAALWATANETSPGTGNAVNKGRTATQDNYTRGRHTPDSPVFFRHRSEGQNVGDWQNLILVKEDGKRFWDETDRSHDGYFAHAMSWTGDPNKMNGGGPVWGILDSAGVEREGWSTQTPEVDRAGGYFFSGDTLEDLASQIIHNAWQWRPMPGSALRETVERFNSFVDSGVDADFGPDAVAEMGLDGGREAPPFKIETPPFYATWSTPVLHDSYTGLRTDTNCQVMDISGALIPGLYCAGESQGGFRSHGLGRCTVFGRVAGMEAARS